MSLNWWENSTLSTISMPFWELFKNTLTTQHRTWLLFNSLSIKQTKKWQSTWETVCLRFLPLHGPVERCIQFWCWIKVTTTRHYIILPEGLLPLRYLCSYELAMRCITTGQERGIHIQENSNRYNTISNIGKLHNKLIQVYSTGYLKRANFCKRVRIIFNTNPTHTPQTYSTPPSPLPPSTETNFPAKNLCTDLANKVFTVKKGGYKSQARVLELP